MANGTISWTAVTATAAGVDDIAPAGAHTGVEIQNQGSVSVYVNTGSTSATADNACQEIQTGETYLFPGPISEQINIISASGNQLVNVKAW